MVKSIVIAAFCVLAFAGCGEREILYADHEVFFDYDPEADLASAEKTLAPGIYEEQLFRPLEDGDPLHIVAGFQGGIWIHLSVRVTGLRGRGQIEAIIEPGGETAYTLRLVRTAEGFLEAYDIPVPVGDRGDSMDDVSHLFGSDATLTIRFTSEDQTVEATRQVVLERG